MVMNSSLLFFKMRNLEEGIETYLSPAEELLWKNKFYIGKDL